MRKSIFLTVMIMAILTATPFSPAFGEEESPSCSGPNAAGATPSDSTFPGCVHPGINPNAFAQGLLGKPIDNGIVKSTVNGRGQQPPSQPQTKIAAPVVSVNHSSIPAIKQNAANNSRSDSGLFPVHSGGGFTGDIEDLMPLMPAIESVLPEVPTPVALSGSDTNRFICPEGSEARDAGETSVIVSKEKGVVIKIVGRNVFIKFLERKMGDKVMLSSTPTDLFVVCGEIVYNIIAVPKNGPSKTIRLVDSVNKVKKNIAQYETMSYEKKLLQIIKSVYKNELPDSFSVQQINKHIELFDGLDIVLARLVTVDGEGLRAKEFRINCIGKEPVELSEKDFLRGEFTTAAAAVIIDKMHLSKGDTARMIIVERSKANGGQ